jgi:hypothetical protein
MQDAGFYEGVITVNCDFEEVTGLPPLIAKQRAALHQT